MTFGFPKHSYKQETVVVVMDSHGNGYLTGSKKKQIEGLLSHARHLKPYQAVQSGKGIHVETKCRFDKCCGDSTVSLTPEDRINRKESRSNLTTGRTWKGKETT